MKYVKSFKGLKETLAVLNTKYDEADAYDIRNDYMQQIRLITDTLFIALENKFNLGISLDLAIFGAVMHVIIHSKETNIPYILLSDGMKEYDKATILQLLYDESMGAV